MNRRPDTKWLTSAGVLFLAAMLVYIIVEGENETRRLEAKKVDAMTMEERLAKLAAEQSLRLDELKLALVQRLAAAEARQSVLATENKELQEILVKVRAASDANEGKLARAQSDLAKVAEGNREVSARLSDLRGALEGIRLSCSEISAKVAKLESELRSPKTDETNSR